MPSTDSDVSARGAGLLDASSALAALRRAAEHDEAPVEARLVVGFVGKDVPLEVLDAAGAHGLRLRGHPDWDTTRADAYLGRGLDPATRSVMAGVLDGRFGRLDAILVSSDCDASQRLYFTLREIRRVEPQTPLPPIHLIDILHLPRESTARYNRVRLGELVDVVAGWTGLRPTDAGLLDAARRRDALRSRQRAVLALRETVPARLTGVDALSVVAAADRMPWAAYEMALETVLRGVDALPAHHGPRVFVTGSGHDRPDVYAAIEASGAVVVGEDHDWGDGFLDGDVLVGGAAPRDVLDAIARRYQVSGPTSQRASIGRRAEVAAAGVARTHADLLLSYSRVMDEAPLWDFAAQRAAVGVPAGAVIRQAYGEVDESALERALRTPQLTGVNG